MGTVALRVFIYSVLPLIMAVGHLGLDRSSRTRERKLEIFLLYLLGVGVAGSGIGGFFGHLFLSDSVAESIGWPTGSPFQLEVGFANLAVGILGIVGMGRRDGFREATVIAVTILGAGATFVHISDIIETGNLAPGNTVQNVGNLLKPALLIGLLVVSRRAERSPASEAHAASFETWRQPRVQAAALMTASVAAGFSVGFAADQPVIGTLVGTLLGAGFATFLVAHSMRRPQTAASDRYSRR